MHSHRPRITGFCPTPQALEQARLWHPNSADSTFTETTNSSRSLNWRCRLTVRMSVGGWLSKHSSAHQRAPWTANTTAQRTALADRRIALDQVFSSFLPSSGSTSMSLFVKRKALNPCTTYYGYSLQPRLLMTCKQIRAECLPILHGRNDLHLEFRGLYDYYVFALWMRGLHPEVFARLRRVTITTRHHIRIPCTKPSQCGYKLRNGRYVAMAGNVVRTCSSMSHSKSICRIDVSSPSKGD